MITLHFYPHINRSNLTVVRMELSRILVIVLFCMMTLSDLANGKRDSLPKIAVVGGGIGGSSAAYFLKQQFGSDVAIDLYEKSEIGGRLATVEIGGKHYEAGGSILHPGNLYMVNFTRLLGLSKQEESGRFSLYDGEETLFTSSPWAVVTVSQLFWRYGWQIVKLNSYIDKLITKFKRIYEHQDRGLAFTTVEKLLESMDSELMAYLHYSTDEVLAHDGFNQKFISELVMAALRNNYGQTPDVQAFVGSVSLAGAESGLWSVAGGNKQVPQRLLDHTKVNVIRSKVNQVILQEVADQRQFEVSSDSGTKVYDLVVIATPLHDNISEISFVNFPKPLDNFSRNYHQTVATFVRGLPNFTQFGYSTIHDIPENIFAINEEMFFNSIGKLHPVRKSSTYKERQELPTWKVFSQKPLSTSELDRLFVSREEVKTVQWKSAYPHYTSSEVNIPPFRLHPGLYYVNAVEIAASCMEMVSVGARNVALLALHDWHDQPALIDTSRYGEFGHSEL